MTVSVLWLFLTVPWVGMQCVIVVFPDHTHLLFFYICAFLIMVSKILHNVSILSYFSSFVYFWIRTYYLDISILFGGFVSIICSMVCNKTPAIFIA